MNAEVTAAEQFGEDGTALHRTALFNPVKDQRQRALKTIRAMSQLGPESWNKLDSAAGITAGDEEGDGTVQAASTLQIDSWAQYGDQVLDDQFVESTIVDTFIAAGFDVSSSLATYAYFNPLRNQRLEAEVTMNARARSEQDMPAHAIDGVPKPIIHVDYEIDGREFEAQQMTGEDPDTTVAREARRALNRRESKILWNGLDRDIPTERGALTVDGLDTDDTTRILQGNSSGWVNAPDEVLSDVDAMHDEIEEQEDVEDQDDVPLVSEIGAYLAIPRGAWGEVMRSDYETEATDEPLIDRIQRKYPYLNILPAPRLDRDSAIMMLADPRYFQIVNSQGVTNTSWEVDGGFALRNKLLSSRIPFVRRQPDGIRGIVRFTGIDA